jgi:plasmid stabilization system protein ParE
MDRKVVWTDAAVDDLETAAEYISKDSPSYAAAFVVQYMVSAKKFCDFGERGPGGAEIKN